MVKYLCIDKISIILISTFLIACGGENVQSTKELEIDSAYNKQEYYKVNLSVDSLINKNETGRLQVSIGYKNVIFDIPKGRVADEKIIHSNQGKYAIVTPIAPDFEIERINAQECFKIDSSGSDVVFLLKPMTTGTHKVSAFVEIYENRNCNEAIASKISKILTVNVTVNTTKEISKKFNELWDITWDKFLIFWGALIALVFTFLLVLIKRRIKKKTKVDLDN